MERQNDHADCVGRFRPGPMIDNRPESLVTWRVTTAATAVATDVASLLGGEPAEWETSAED
ncbi:hypothetical protein [Kitasatospora sp. NPDC093558]|uniref:hypothetical protein n=1 Tax=Kitasatospora sp. NPDC093558 TaxID=3155201 RepID=UPI003417DE57